MTRNRLEHFKKLKSRKRKLIINYPKEIKSLARTLSFNYVNASINEASSLEANKFLKDCRGYKPAGRVVLVVGAGASNAAVGLPLGKEAANWLNKRLAPNEKLVDEELRRLTSIYRLNREDFETRLLALSKFYPVDLLKELQNLYARRFYVSQVYEIIAHMLKHRFLDAIINFNFDELLDQSLDDELGAGNYYRVISDGDCPSELVDMDESTDSFRLPLYIKPHGTASHKSTMRFTDEAYFVLPDDIRLLLNKAFGMDPITLIIIGYAMQSIEFREIIKEHSNNIRDVIVFNKEPLEGFKELGLHSSMRFVAIKDKTTLEGQIIRLWESVETEFQDWCKPRGIARHILISKIFANKVDINKPDNQRKKQITKYLMDRFYFELLLAIAKAKGFVNLTQLAAGRAGAYYNLYRSYEGEKAKSLLTFCEEVGLRQWDYSGNAFRMITEEPSISLKENRLVIPEYIFAKDCIPQMIKLIKPRLSRERQDMLRKHERVLREALKEMYNKEEVELQGNGDLIHYHMFENPTHLTTMLAFKASTREVLEKDWDLFLCIAEAGDWLRGSDIEDLIKRRKGRKMIVIVCDVTYEKELKGLYRDQDVHVLVMPWWLHNQHMTLVLHGRECQEAVFFERRLREQSVSAVRLERKDCGVLLDVFSSYAYKARRYMDDPQMMVVEKEDSEREKDRILSRKYNP